MRKVRKLVWYTLVTIAFTFFGLVIVSNIISHIYGYHKIDAFFPNVHYPIKYFKDSARKKITVESVWKNGFNDSVYTLKYADSFKIALWTINQNVLVDFTTSIDTNQKRIIRKSFAAYESLSLDLLNMNRKAFNHNLKNVSIRFNKCMDIHSIINTKNYQYYYLKAWEIYLISDTNSYYDICLGLSNSAHCDFMAFIMNNKLYILALYSIKGKDISPNTLLDIVNFPIK